VYVIRFAEFAIIDNVVLNTVKCRAEIESLAVLEPNIPTVYYHSLHHILTVIIPDLEMILSLSKPCVDGAAQYYKKTLHLDPMSDGPGDRNDDTDVWNAETPDDPNFGNACRLSLALVRTSCIRSVAPIFVGRNRDAASASFAGALDSNFGPPWEASPQRDA
jgi:hypothetical protein